MHQCTLCMWLGPIKYSVCMVKHNFMASQLLQCQQPPPVHQLTHSTTCMWFIIMYSVCVCFYMWCSESGGGLVRERDARNET